MTGFSESATPPPAWLRWFANDAARSILDTQFHAPVGCHYFYCEDRDEWEVAVFVSATEVFGGPRDGTVVPCPFQADVSHVIGLFDRPPRVHWQTGTVHEEEDVGQLLSFEGVVRGRRVWLRLLGEAHPQICPGRLLHAHTGKIEDVWQGV